MKNFNNSTKVKLFEEVLLNDLESVINKFLEKVEKTGKIIDIKYSTKKYLFSAMVIYKI